MTTNPSGEPVDPDLSEARSTRILSRADAPTVAVIALGGVIGATGRYEAGLWWSTAPDAFPWTTFGINLLGSAALSVLIVLVIEVWTNRPLLRPLLGTGVIGGFTTFSTFSVDTQRLLSRGDGALAVAYVLVTLLACGAGTWGGAHLTRTIIRRPVR